jgi:hypothetical protein
MEGFIAILYIGCAICIGWLQGNLKYIANIMREPWVYWLLFSLPQTYFGMYGWWKLVEYTNKDMWRAMILSSSTAFLVQISLNSWFWGVNYKAILGLFLVVLGGIIAR